MESVIQSDVLDTILMDSEKFMDGWSEFHKAAVRAHYLDEAKPLPITTITPAQHDKLVYLEKIMDWHVLNSRMREKNENVVCGSRGNIDETYMNKFDEEKERLSKEGKWIDFPMVDLVNGFGVHWYYKQEDDKCDTNSFSLRDSVHYALNNVTLSYKDYEDKFKGDYDKLIREEAGIHASEVIEIGDYVEITEPFKFNRVQLQGMYGVVISEDARYGCLVRLVETLSVRDGKKVTCISEVVVPPAKLSMIDKHWILDQAYYGNDRIKKKFKERFIGLITGDVEFKDYDQLYEEENKEAAKTPVEWKPKEVESIFEDMEVKETLSFDSRLLVDLNLSVPMICMPSIFRKGVADFHCVYFEGHNAMGQLEEKKENFATILIVREDQKEEYVKRYYSDHTYFVALDTRKNSSFKGYSAGDSKFYCYRVSSFLYDMWGTPTGEGKQRVLIMDDQMQPFAHEIPVFRGNKELDTKGSLEVAKETYLDDGTPIEADTYEFRRGFEDETGISMLYGGFSRFPITHAALLKYMDRVSTITGAGLVCASSGKAEMTNMTLRTKAYKNVVWLFDLEAIDIGGFSSPLNPAYQASEDMFMSQVLASHDIKVVTCNTMRWRKSVTGGGTCGRQGVGEGPKPMTPIIKYHELLKTCHFENYPKLREGAYKKTKDHVVINAGYPFDNFKVYYRTRYAGRRKRKDTSAIEFSVEGYGICHVVLRLDLKIDCAGGPIKWNHPYGSRHAINLIALLVLKQVEQKLMDNTRRVLETPQFAKGECVKAKWGDKWYDGVIRRYNRQKKMYDVLFDDGQWDLVEPKNIEINKSISEDVCKGKPRLKF
tara:strand:- start:2739 stop:5216 length:2478 start_codon:yes stop_codon:yes gene_type:complete